MPVYDYKCKTHGLFHELSTFDESAQPKACPTCGELSGRIIMINPNALINSEQSQMIERNQKAQHEPVFSNKEIRAENEEKAKYGCGCHQHQKDNRKSKVFYTAEGNKMFPSMRPWMISH